MAYSEVAGPDNVAKAESLSDTRPFLRVLRSILPHVAAVATLGLLLAIFFWPLTVQHKVLSPADWIYGSYPWAADPPEGYVLPENANQGDDAFISYPRRWAFYNGDGEGWWQDDYLAGTRRTFSVDHAGLDFYPPSWVYHLMPFHVANGFFHALVLLTAGVSMYLLLWQLKQPWLSAVFGGFLWMLNGHFIVWLGAFSLPAIMGLVPLMIFGFERFRESRAPPWLLIPAAALAVQIYLAYVPGWIVTGGILIIYGIVRLAPMLWRREVRDALVNAGGYVGSAVLGVLLGAFALIPTIVISANSDYQQDRVFGLARIDIENAWTYLFPEYWGSEAVPSIPYLSNQGDYPSIIAYFGITVVPLALVGAWKGRRTWVTWFAVAVLVFSLSQIYGIPPLSELAHLPGLKQTAALRWNVGLPLAVAMLAPLGLTAITNGLREKREDRLLALAVAGLMAVILTSVGVLWAERSDSETFRLITEGRGVFPAIDDISAEIESLSTHFHRQIVLALLGGGLLMAGLLLPLRWGRGIGVALVVLAFVDLTAFGSDYNATIEKEDLYPKTEGVEFLEAQEGEFRIAPVFDRLDPFPAYTSNLYGLDTILGYDHFRDDDYFNFLAPQRSPIDDSYFAGAGYVNIGSYRWPLNENLIQVLNVKYVVTPPEGLYYELSGQPRNEAPLPVFGHVTHAQLLPAPDGLDAIEVLLGTGTGRTLDYPVTFRLTGPPGTGAAIHEWTVPGADIVNNRWFPVELPDDLDVTGDIFFEIEARDAPDDAPLYVWAISGAGPDGWQRYAGHIPMDGALSLRALQDPGDWVKPVYSGDDLVIYEVADSLPRAWGASDVEEAANKEEAMARVAEADFDPATDVVVLEGDVAEDYMAVVSDLEIDITDYQSDRMTLDASSSDGGLAVISTRFDEGWKATVDGEEAEIVRADGILMAVEVPPGDHTVELEFAPGDITWGRRVTIVTAILTAFALGAYAVYRFRARRP